EERCDAAFSLLSRGGVYYAFLFQSQPLISGFFSHRAGYFVKCFTLPSRWRRIIGISVFSTTLFSIFSFNCCFFILIAAIPRDLLNEQTHLRLHSRLNPTKVFLRLIRNRGDYVFFCVTSL
ncbi:hypothetical protein QLY58_20520, partial [Cronobacter sakazakii]|nr:hypothetical protein [Cronobacter sakazakii]